MRVAVLSLLALARPARADDGSLTLREGTLVRPGDEPLLELDPVWRPTRALDAPIDIARAVVLAADTLVTLESSRWSYDNGMTGDGWGATVRLARTLGPFRVSGFASYQALDTRLGAGSYVDLGISIGRTHRLSRWMIASISLGLWHRQWNGRPPPGEADSTTIMLSVGTTFR